LNGLRLWLSRNGRALFALALFLSMFCIYVIKNGVGLKMGLATAVANKGVLLALVAMAQTIPVLTGGIDLSVGMIFVLTNCIASAVLSGPPWMVAVGVVVVLLSGVVCGAINGALVVYGRLQPIIATLATGAVYYGLALIIRPVPGGSIDATLASALTNQFFGIVPTTLVILVAVVLVVWVPFQLSMTGRGCYAIGSSEMAAYMTGIAVRRSRLTAYVLAGLLAAFGGILLTAMTLSSDASVPARDVHAKFHCSRCDRRHIADGWGWGRDWLDLRCVRLADRQRPALRLRHPAAHATVYPRPDPARGRQPGAIRVLRAPNRLQFLGAAR